MTVEEAEFAAVVDVAVDMAETPPDDNDRDNDVVDNCNIHSDIAGAAAGSDGCGARDDTGRAESCSGLIS